jgi:hypothetical protein
MNNGVKFEDTPVRISLDIHSYQQGEVMRPEEAMHTRAQDRCDRTATLE